MSDKDAANQTGPDQSALQQQLQEQYLKSLDELEVGQVVEGVIVQVGSENAFIDVGYKSEGKVPLEEFDEKPTIGDTVEVVLVSKETQSGETVVSKRKADEKIYWRRLKDAFNEHQPIEGKVTKSIKGGFEVMIGPRIRAFNPISKMDLHRVENPEEYVGLESLFYVERIYSEHRVNVVVSRRDWLEEDVERRKAEFFDNTTIGDEVEGTVKSFTSFGAFIDLGGFDGLLHINDMSWGHVTRPKDVVKKGEVITLRVIRMDPEEQKINLSLKHMTEDPWYTFEDRYQIDQVVTGRVTKLTDFGAFIELEEGIEGLAHISELSWVKRIRHPEEILRPGDEVETKILDYDLQQGKVSLGLKQVLPNPWDDIADSYPVGLRLTRPVKKITNTGAFVELEEGIDGFLHVDDLSWTKRYRNPGAVLTEGEEIDCIVIDLDPLEHNIRLGVKQLSEDPWESLKSAFPEGTIIEGEVTNITDFGVFVRVQGGIEGLVNKAQVADPRIQSFDDAVRHINVGDEVNAVVTEVSIPRQKLSLSFRELERKQQREELEKYIHDEEEESTVTLGDFLKDKDGSS